MTAGSDNTDQPAESDNKIKPETPSVGNSGMTDGSSVQSQTSTGAKPFMIYPIPKVGGSGAAAGEIQTPEGMTYEEALAVNSPILQPKAPDIEEGAPATATSKPEEIPAISNTESKSVKRRERVSKTLLDYAVPEVDALGSIQPPKQPSVASNKTTAPQESSPQQAQLVSNVSNLSNVSNELSPSASPTLKAPSTPTPNKAKSQSAENNDDIESSAAILHRIKDAQAINHMKKEAKILLPPVPPPMRRKKGVARTMMDMFVNIGNQLTGSATVPEPEFAGESHAIDHVDSPIQADNAPPDYAPHEVSAHNAEEPVNYQGSQENLQQVNSDQQYCYENAAGTVPAQESRGERIPRTLLDLSVLSDIELKSSEKKILKAAEEQKEKLNEPFVPFIAVEENKLAKACPWKWEGDEGKERVKYCGVCQHQVYNFAGIERPEADAIIFKREGHEAKTLYKRDDGKFMISDCPMAGKKQREMVLAVVGGLFLLIIVIGCMMLIPHPVATTTTTPTDDEHRDSSTDGSRVRVTSKSRKGSSDSSSGSNSATETGNSSSSGTASGSANSPPTPALNGNSNGGYGPPAAAPGAPSADDWKWQYNNDSQKNPPQTIPPGLAPTIIQSTPQVDPEKAEEIQRLKDQVDNSSESR